MRIVFLTLLLVVPAVAHAASDGADDQNEAPAQQAPAKPEPIPKVTAPLFPKHRRGLYLNGLGLEVLDATPQSPPLDTDDPGVPENGTYEVNLTVDADVSRYVSKSDLLIVDANYGLLLKASGRELPTQLKFEVPVAGAAGTGNPFAVGVGAAMFGMKFNFYNSEHHAFAMSFYPQLEFVVGSRAVEKGLAEPGQTLIFPLLVSKIFRYATLSANVAVNVPVHDLDRHNTGTFGVGLGLAVTRKFVAMTELHSETRFDLAHDRLLIANVGLMRAVGHTVVLYTNGGHSLFSDDGSGHTYVGVGVKLLIAPPWHRGPSPASLSSAT